MQTTGLPSLDLTDACFHIPVAHWFWKYLHFVMKSDLAIPGPSFQLVHSPCGVHLSPSSFVNPPPCSQCSFPSLSQQLAHMGSHLLLMSELDTDSAVPPLLTRSGSQSREVRHSPFPELHLCGGTVSDTEGDFPFAL